MRRSQRKFEEVVGSKLIDLASRRALSKSKLIPKTVLLPQMGIPLHYLERPSTLPPSQHPPTCLFCHGLSDQAKNLAAFITSLNIPSEVRILVPDAIGHGQDLDRAKQDPKGFQQPTTTSILASTSEFLQVLEVEKCNAFGYSMGGALAYFLRYKYPCIVQKTVLVSPSLESCLDAQFIDDFVQGRKNHWCLTSRDDAKRLFRDLSVPHRTKKDPILKFFLEALWRRQAIQAPPGHYRAMLEGLLEEVNDENSEFSITRDVDHGSPRLVLWPEYDFICNHEKGKAFFAASAANTKFETLLDCGHMFHSNGTFVLDLVRPRVAKYLLDF